MTDLRQVALTYLQGRNTDLDIEQQILLAFGAGAIFGSNIVTSAVEAKALMFKLENVK